MENSLSTNMKASVWLTCSNLSSDAPQVKTRFLLAVQWMYVCCICMRSKHRTCSPNWRCCLKIFKTHLDSFLSNLLQGISYRRWVEWDGLLRDELDKMIHRGSFQALQFCDWGHIFCCCYLKIKIKNHRNIGIRAITTGARTALKIMSSIL